MADLSRMPPPSMSSTISELYVDTMLMSPVLPGTP